MSQFALLLASLVLLSGLTFIAASAPKGVPDANETGKLCGVGMTSWRGNFAKHMESCEIKLLDGTSLSSHAREEWIAKGAGAFSAALSQNAEKKDKSRSAKIGWSMLWALENRNNKAIDTIVFFVGHATNVAEPNQPSFYHRSDSANIVSFCFGAPISRADVNNIKKMKEYFDVAYVAIDEFYDQQTKSAAAKKSELAELEAKTSADDN